MAGYLIDYLPYLIAYAKLKSLELYHASGTKKPIRQRRPAAGTKEYWANDFCIMKMTPKTFYVQPTIHSSETLCICMAKYPISTSSSGFFKYFSKCPQTTDANRKASGNFSDM